MAEILPMWRKSLTLNYSETVIDLFNMYILFLPQLSNLKVSFLFFTMKHSPVVHQVFISGFVFFNVNINCTKQFLPGRQMLPI